MDFLERMASRLAQREAERAQIEAARIEQNRRLVTLNKEAEEDEIALRVYRQVCPEGAAAHELPKPRSLIAPPPDAPPVKDMVLAILKASPSALTAKQIKGMAQIRFRAAINPNTLTVTLSRHKKDQAIRLEGRAWRYVPEGERITAAVESGDLLESRH